MPKTHANLWARLVSWDNLVAAYRRCRRRKRHRRVAAAFDFDWESQLLALARDLREGRYQPGPYRHFRITDPKPRKISAAPFRDRVVHHALVQVLEPIFDRGFIHDSYACRVGKGTHAAILRARGYLRRHAHLLKTDIVRFFPNVDHAVLRGVIGRRIADPDVMQLVDAILASGAGVLADEATPSFFPGDDLFALARPRGLPIGNLTSQFFANVLLDRIDHFVKETLRVPGYVRYADDLLLFGDDKADLHGWRKAIEGELAGLRLRLHPDKTQIAPVTVGVTFLGWRLTPGSMRLSQRSIRRFSRRLRQLRWRRQQGEISTDRVGASVRAWLAHAAHGNTRGISRRVLRRPV
jgi:retron-type reverse transcriptase